MFISGLEKTGRNLYGIYLDLSSCLAVEYKFSYGHIQANIYCITVCCVLNTKKIEIHVINA